MARMRRSGELEAKLREIAAKVANPGTLRVGFLEGSTEADGTSVPLIAAVQEFGSPTEGIPARPFFRSMVDAKSPGWGAAVAAILKANDYDATNALEQLGEGIKGQLQQSIIDTNAPPLAPATVKAKGSAKPLIDTGTMIKSVDWEVKP